MPFIVEPFTLPPPVSYLNACKLKDTQLRFYLLVSVRCGILY